MSFTWTPEAEAALRKHHADGLSFSHIAARLGGGLTRNAAIGKAKRLGLPDRIRKAPPAPKPKSNPGGYWGYQGSSEFYRAAASPSPLDRASPSVPPPDGLAHPLVTLGDLKPSSCRFPIGDPLSHDFGFCGGARHGDLPYCEFHARIAYLPSPAKRNRERAA